jgi:hypothetical protein
VDGWHLLKLREAKMTQLPQIEVMIACICILHHHIASLTYTTSNLRPLPNMVLEEATRPTESFDSDAPPSNDTDPYADRNPPYTSTREPNFASVARDGAHGKIFVNMANLPKPFSPFGERPHPQMFVESIQDSCRFAQQVLQRPCTQEEADAFAYHAAKTFRVASFGSPIGMALASVQFFRTREQFRFPGWSPFKDQSNWSKDRLGPLRGPVARLGWHSLRLGSYWVLGSVAGAIFFGSYAISLSLAGRATDPRLKEFSEKLRQMQKDGISTQAIRRQQDKDSTTQEETFEQRRQRRAVQGISRESAQSMNSMQTTSSQSRDWDDASPTGSAFSNEYADASGDTGILDDSQMIQRQTQQQADAWSSSAENRASTVDLNKAASQRSSANRQAANQGEGVASAPQPVSSWERLRQQAASDTPTISGTPRRSRAESSDHDSFSFSSGEEDKQLAKTEAQREFDARLERERSGKDFDEGSGRKRW